MLAYSTHLPICTFVLFDLGSSPLTIAKSWLGAKHRPRLLIFRSTICLSHMKFVPLSKISDAIIACDFWLAPRHPNQKSWIRQCIQHKRRLIQNISYARSILAAFLTYQNLNKYRDLAETDKLRQNTLVCHEFCGAYLCY